MADEPNTDPDPENDPDPEQDPSATDEPEDPGDDIEKMRAALKKANEEAKKHRLKAKELEPLAAKAKELEESQKSEQDKLAEQLEAAKSEGTKASRELTRLDVALDKAPEGLSVAKVRKLAKRLTGETREELEADAEELFAEFAPPEAEKPSGKPRPRIVEDKPSQSEETDPRKLAANLPRHY